MALRQTMVDIEAELYNRFTTTINRFELIPRDKKRVFIFYSGGKDASALASLFLKYKEMERPDLEIGLITVLFPEIVYKSSESEQIRLLNQAFEHWKNKGYSHRLMDLPKDIGDNLFDNKDVPCEVCEEVKTKLIFDELSLPYYNNSLICMAHTLEDIIGYLIEIQLIAGSYSSWKEIFKSDIELFNRIAILAKRVYPKYKPQNMNITYIKPLIELNEPLIKNYVDHKEIPLIPECCADKKGPQFRMYKRTVMDGLNWLEKRYKQDAFCNKFIYKNYEKVITFYNNAHLLPPIEEIEALGLKSGI